MIQEYFNYEYNKAKALWEEDKAVDKFEMVNNGIQRCLGVALYHLRNEKSPEVMRMYWDYHERFLMLLEK